MTPGKKQTPPPRKIDPRAFYAELLRTRTATPEGVVAFITSNREEGQWHDYKDARLLTEKDAAAKIRDEYAAFANADGGVLFFGVEDGTLDLQNIEQAKGVLTPAAYITRALQPLTPYLTAPPLLVPVSIGPNQLYLLAAPRNDNLIPSSTGMSLMYRLRIGESSVPCPEYLVTDLLQGRRNRPIVHVEFRRKANPREPGDGLPAIEVLIRNDGFQRIPLIDVAFIQAVDQESVPDLPTPVTLRLRQTSASPSKMLMQTFEGQEVFPPLQQRVHVRLSYPKTGRRHTTNLHQSAVIVMPQGADPQWFAIDDLYKLNSYGLFPVALDCRRVYADERIPIGFHTLFGDEQPNFSELGVKDMTRSPRETIAAMKSHLQIV